MSQSITNSPDEERGNVGCAKFLVNCQTCDFWSVEPDMQNADRVRDGHEMEMFNWRGDSEPCGPCAVALIRSQNEIGDERESEQ